MNTNDSNEKAQRLTTYSQPVKSGTEIMSIRNVGTGVGLGNGVGVASGGYVGNIPVNCALRNLKSSSRYPFGLGKCY